MDPKSPEPVSDVDPVPYNDERSEEIILKYIGSLFVINVAGEVWRIGTMRRGDIFPCEARRAEYASTNGYLRVRLMINGIRIRVSAHRLVFRYYHGPIPQNAIVNHEDCNRSNNHPRNLTSMSQSSNIHHGGRWKKKGQG